MAADSLLSSPSTSFLFIYSLSASTLVALTRKVVSYIRLGHLSVGQPCFESNEKRISTHRLRLAACVPISCSTRTRALLFVFVSLVLYCAVNRE